MVKRAGGFGLALPPRDSSAPPRRWFYGALRAAILQGQLRPGTRLPSTRELAKLYGISRGTVVNAFAQLASEGYIDGAAGYSPLREAIAAYLATSRGVSCEPDQVVIVSGVQEALDLVARMVLTPGDAVCVEEPGYPGATYLLEAFGARLIAMPVDGEGMEVRPSRMRGLASSM